MKTEMTQPTIEEQKEMVRNAWHFADMQCEPDDVLASLDELAAIKSQPVPVEPAYVLRMLKRAVDESLNSKGMGIHDGKAHVDCSHLQNIFNYIDSLQSALRVAQQEILDTTWQDHADHWKKRAEQAEKDRDICYISLQDMRRRLHEIASLVTDPRLDEKHTA